MLQLVSHKGRGTPGGQGNGKVTAKPPPEKDSPPKKEKKKKKELGERDRKREKCRSIVKSTKEKQGGGWGEGGRKRDSGGNSVRQ
jgi:hypothetical protein